jgi:hypothetical protein
MQLPPAALVSGGNILALLAATGAFRKTAEQLLAERGITNVRSEEWYPLSACAEVLHDLERRVGPNALFRIGKEIPNHIQLPAGLDTFEKVAGSFGPAFALNHRNAADGGIEHEITGPDSATIVSGTPYPCDFDRGVIFGFYQSLLQITPHYQHDAQLCKKKGSSVCVHYVSRRAAER